MSNTDINQTNGKKSSPFLKYWFVWLAMIVALPFVIFGIYLGYVYMVQLPKAKQARTQLQFEFGAITPLPNVNVVKNSSTYDESSALVEASYLIDMNADDIFKYYDEQLKQHGWQSQGIRKVEDWGRDLGGKIADYCKGDYGAELQYAGQNANYGWTYGFSVDWGLNNCKVNK